MQKVWLGIFLAMFLVPEILWSPVGNFIYELSQPGGQVHSLRNNFLINTDNVNWYSSVLFIQFLGLLLSAICLIIIRKNFKRKSTLWIGCFLLFLASLLVLLLFGLSVSLRHIGF